MPELLVPCFKHELELFDRRTGQLVDRAVAFNRIPQLGMDFLMLAPFGVTPSIDLWYCGLFSENFVATAATKASDIPTTMREFTAYSEPGRPEWQYSYDGAGTLSNGGDKAVFTPTQDGNVYGSFIASSSEKGGTGGLLLSVARFDTVRNLTADIEAKLSCGITYLPTNAV